MKYVNTITVIFSYFWSVIMRVIVNPKDQLLENTSSNGDQYYGDDVNKNFPTFCLVFFIYTLVASMLPILFIKEPKSLIGTLREGYRK